MYMLVAFLALLAFLGEVVGKSAKNVECAKGGNIESQWYVIWYKLEQYEYLQCQ